MKKNFFLFMIFLLGTSCATLSAAPREVNLYGHLVSTSEYGTPQGIYQFSNGPAAGFARVAEIAAEPNAGAVRAGDLYYVFNISNQGDYGNEYSMYIYDPANGYTLITRASASSSFMSEAQVLAYDPVTKKIYCAYNDAYYGNRLATIDVSHRTRDLVASLDYTKFVTLSFNSHGQLYGITNVGILYEINKSTGETRYIGSTGVSPAEYQQAATFVDGNDSTLYWAACSASQGALYAVDVTSAKTTLVKVFAHEEEFATLWAGSAVVQDAAPAAAANLKAQFQNGALSGELTFTAPQLTHSGQPLAGPLNYAVKVDGKEQATGTVEPGAQARCPLTTTQGLHDFAVVVSNQAGNGDEATLKHQYIGHDTPGMVRNVRLERGETSNELVLTWDAPENGIHGGYLDPASVKYKVRRMPADTIVSSTATSPFKEVVEAVRPARCFYDVIPYVDENTQGLPMSSNKIMIGTPCTVPYSEDFSSNDNVTTFTIEDGNDDGSTWEYMYDYGYMRVWNSEGVKDEWLFTPYIAMEAGAEYRLTFDVRSLSNEKMEVKIGDDATSASMGTTLLNEFDVTDYDWKMMKCNFKVEATKPWFIGFHSTTTDYANALAIYLDNIKVEKVADAPHTGVDDVDQGNLFSIDGNNLVLTASQASAVTVCTIDGRIAYAGSMLPGQSVWLDRGIYVVVIDGRPCKAVVK